MIKKFKTGGTKEALQNLNQIVDVCNDINAPSMNAKTKGSVPTGILYWGEVEQVSPQSDPLPEPDPSNPSDNPIDDEIFPGPPPGGSQKFIGTFYDGNGNKITDSSSPFYQQNISCNYDLSDVEAGNIFIAIKNPFSLEWFALGIYV